MFPNFPPNSPRSVHASTTEAAERATEEFVEAVRRGLHVEDVRQMLAEQRVLLRATAFGGYPFPFSLENDASHSTSAAKLAAPSEHAVADLCSESVPSIEMCRPHLLWMRKSPNDIRCGFPFAASRNLAPIHVAAHCGHAAMVQLLLEDYEADVAFLGELADAMATVEEASTAADRNESSNKNGNRNGEGEVEKRPPIGYYDRGCFLGPMPPLSYVITHVASNLLDVNAGTNAHANTAMHLAAEMGHGVVARLLAEWRYEPSPTLRERLSRLAGAACTCGYCNGRRGGGGGDPANAFGGADVFSFFSAAVAVKDDVPTSAVKKNSAIHSFSSVTAEAIVRAGRAAAADLWAPNSAKQTPALVAATKGQRDVFSFLLSCYASDGAVGDGGRAALTAASAFALAASLGHEGIIEDVLAFSTPLSVTCDLRNALFLASKGRFLGILRRIVRAAAGADTQLSIFCRADCCVLGGISTRRSNSPSSCSPLDRCSVLFSIPRRVCGHLPLFPN